MKTIICHLLILVVFLGLNIQKTGAVDEKTAKEAAQTCSKDSSLTGAELQRILTNQIYDNKQPEASKNIKCFLMCFYKKVGLISENGQRKMDTLLEYVERKYPEKKDAVKAALDKCANTKMPDPCDEVYAFESCLWKVLLM